MGCSDSRTPEPVTTVVKENVVVVAQNDHNPLGLKFSIRAGRLFVRLIEGGAISEWNVKNPGRQVSVGDQIASVNGESTSMSKMLTHLHLVGQIQIHFCSNSQVTSGSSRGHRLGHPFCSHTGQADGETQQYHRAASRGTQLVELPFVSAANLGDVTCCICLEQMDPEVRVMELPCKHHFHLECAAQWLSRKGACPLCARPLVPAPMKDDEANHTVPSEVDEAPGRHAAAAASAAARAAPREAARARTVPATGELRTLSSQLDKQTI